MRELVNKNKFVNMNIDALNKFFGKNYKHHEEFIFDQVFMSTLKADNLKCKFYPSMLSIMDINETDFVISEIEQVKKGIKL